MAKFQSPLLGFNNNVRHRGRVFHIQTEDSGVNHPHVITHLFMDGGRILKSVKKSYAEHVGSDAMNDTVRVLMKEQHKAMFTALKDGQFDELVDPKKGSDAKAPKVMPPPAQEAAPAPVQVQAKEAEHATDDGWGSPPEAEAPPPPTQPEPAPPPPLSVRREVEELAPNTIDEGRRPATPSLPAAASAVAPEPFTLETSGPHTVPEGAIAIEPQGRRPSAAELTLDFDALERDSGGGMSPIYHQQQNDLPPPPKNLFARERGTGAYSTLEVEHHDDDTRAPARPSTRPSTQPSPRPSASPPRKSLPPIRREESARRDDRRENSSRYAPSRPANIFGTTLKPAAGAPPPTASIFGDDLVSDKSLDEVILSYLAEDLDPKR